MDLRIFEYINSFAGQWFLLDQLGIFLAQSAGYALLGILAFLFLFRSYQRRMVIVSAISAVVARGILVTAIRFFYHRARPISVDAVHQLVTNDKWAFPSGHASFFFALSTGVYLYNKKLGIFFYAVSLLMGVARIFVGVHWPSDILGGAFLGTIVGIVVKKIFDRAVPGGRVELP